MDKKPASGPVLSVQTPNTPPKQAFPWLIVILIVIIIIALTAGITFYLTKGSAVVVNNPQPTPQSSTPAADPSPAIAASPTAPAIALPANKQSCDVSDSTFCDVVTDLKSTLASGNYAGFLAYQNIQSTTCNPDGMFVSICEGIPKDEVKAGYGIGHNQSEGSLVSKTDYLASVSDYVSTNGPFIYRGSRLSGNKGAAVFLNAKKDHLLLFPLKKTGSNWRMDNLIVGGTFGDTSFETLSASLLDFIR